MVGIPEKAPKSALLAIASIRMRATSAIPPTALLRQMRNTTTAKAHDVWLLTSTTPENMMAAARGAKNPNVAPARMATTELITKDLRARVHRSVEVAPRPTQPCMELGNTDSPAKNIRIIRSPAANKGKAAGEKTPTIVTESAVYIELAPLATTDCTCDRRLARINLPGASLRSFALLAPNARTPSVSETMLGARSPSTGYAASGAPERIAQEASPVKAMRGTLSVKTIVQGLLFPRKIQVMFKAGKSVQTPIRPASSLNEGETRAAPPKATTDAKDNMKSFAWTE